MFRQQYTDNDAINGHTLTKFVVSAVLVSGLVFGGLKAFNLIISDTELLTLELKQERLERALAYIHQQWNQRGQPRQLTLKFQFSTGELYNWVVNVNKFGWPVVIGDSKGDVVKNLDCDNIWRFLVLEQTNEPVDLDGVQVLQSRNKCQFEKKLSKQRLWKVEYNTENGRLLNN
ncbi:hypothetical protein Q4575_01810 [Psychrosphaera sp. 1_MG-2023]|uniref:hypothetical protein n=1 Tax=Psychrosphaera sp. 1_MG-2023 TaxID=3062643 RepID=UPI0026E13B9B|nr:hypothetical protein [Psychrosphaera sp. 1_MG-2023]MDO6718114.1 hypothetical protein [Psychrosphaera sp. 1_MG-2023]